MLAFVDRFGNTDLPPESYERKSWKGTFLMSTRSLPQEDTKLDIYLWSAPTQHNDGDQWSKRTCQFDRGILSMHRSSKIWFHECHYLGLRCRQASFAEAIQRYSRRNMEWPTSASRTRTTVHWHASVDWPASNQYHEMPPVHFWIQITIVHPCSINFDGSSVIRDIHRLNNTLDDDYISFFSVHSY